MSIKERQVPKAMNLEGTPLNLSDKAQKGLVLRIHSNSND